MCNTYWLVYCRILFLYWLVHLIVFLEPSFLVSVNFVCDQQMFLNVCNVTGVQLQELM